jgi:hypothetical protein
LFGVFEVRRKVGFLAFCVDNANGSCYNELVVLVLFCNLEQGVIWMMDCHSGINCVDAISRGKNNEKSFFCLSNDVGGFSVRLDSLSERV